ncbi:MAG: hypothetical protein ACOCT7_02200 [Candidatus Saliniplasma sp.]
MKRKVRLRRDEGGALEGLPLYLILLVVIAGVSTAIVFGWMQSAESTELDHIKVDVSDGYVTSGSSNNVEITVYDRNDDELSGATVTLQGCGVKEIGETDSDGKAEFSVSPSLPENEDFGEITVTVKYTGDVKTEKTDTVPVKG